MPRASNPFEYDGIADVLLTLEYTAVADEDRRRKVIAERPRRVEQQQFFGLRGQFVEAWYRLANISANAGQNPSCDMTLVARNLPGNLRDFKVSQVSVAIIFAPNAEQELSSVSVSKEGGPSSGPAATSSGLVRFGADWGDPLGRWTLTFPGQLRQLIAEEKVSEILLALTYSAERR